MSTHSSDYNNGHDPNSGHGHVYKRPDGVKARCGGPPLCSECARDMAALQASYRPQQPVAQVTSNPMADIACLKARLRRYLPNLGIYAADVRTAVELIEDFERNNAALVILAKTATQDAAAEALWLVGPAPETPERRFHEGERQSYLKAVELSVASGMLGDGDKSDLLEMYQRLWPRAPSDVRANALKAEVGGSFPEKRDV